MKIRKLIAGTVLAGSVLIAGAQAATAAPADVCSTYWHDTTYITAEEAQLETAAALAGQTVTEYCGTDAAKTNGRPDRVAEKLTTKLR